MTSLAFVLGVVPLLLASGAGAAARHSMGTGVFGGMIAATFISTIFVPVFFTWFARRKKTAAELAKPQPEPETPKLPPQSTAGEVSVEGKDKRDV